MTTSLNYSIATNMAYEVLAPMQRFFLADLCKRYFEAVF